MEYCIAVAAERFRMQLHAFVVLSNHWHLVVTDPEARLPQFLHWVHEFTAKCLNAVHGRMENLWSSEQTSVVELVEEKDVLDKILYVLMNPVKAGLVPRSVEWPGAISSAQDLAGASKVVARPKVFFSETGRMPAEARLEIVKPAMMEDSSGEQVAATVAELLAEREAAMQDEVARKGDSFLGVRAILRQRPGTRPATAAARGGLSPRVAAKDKEERKRALARWKGFREAYKKALEKWQAGVREVLFPAGTYAMRVFHGAACAEAGST